MSRTSPSLSTARQTYNCLPLMETNTSSRSTARPAEAVLVSAGAARVDLSLFFGYPDLPSYLTRCQKCGKKFERIETISEHEALKLKCPKCGSKKVSFVRGNV